MKTLRFIYHGVPYFFLLCFGLVVAFGADVIGWNWLCRFNEWLMAKASRIEEAME